MSDQRRLDASSMRSPVHLKSETNDLFSLRFGGCQQRLVFVGPEPVNCLLGDVWRFDQRHRVLGRPVCIFEQVVTVEVGVENSKRRDLCFEGRHCWRSTCHSLKVRLPRSEVHLTLCRGELARL